MKSFTKTTKVIYTPRWVKKNFTIYDDKFISIRKDMKYKCNTCFRCNRKFNIGDVLALVSFDKIGNKIMCVECVSEIE